MVKRGSGVVLIVEGGGAERSDLKVECRRGFHRLLEQAGWKSRMPTIIAGGSRRDAFEKFKWGLEEFLAGRSDHLPLLLVDSEGPVKAGSPWAHVKARKGDGWARPEAAQEDHLHLMVECMEAWFLSDREALERFFGKGFRESALPAASKNVETAQKVEIYAALEKASRDTTKGTYAKGPHSFKLLATIDPAKVRASSPWAERFFSVVDRLDALAR
ncbi:MAG: DUF4276 family protein [Polyangiaceae bacterium]